MAPASEKHCQRCGGKMLERESACPRCLLQAVDGEGTAAREERLFAQLLALEPSARPRFLEELTRDAPELRVTLEQLLQGYYETIEQDPSAAEPAPDPSASPAGPELLRSILETEEPGARIGNFRLVRPVGEGGMGSVWEAEQVAPVRRTVALKLIKLGMDTREVVKRFQRERQTLALLTHPNIAQVFEAGATILGRPYFVMEWVPGDPLTSWCSRHQCDLEARCRLLLEVCNAVEHAHQKGVIHRDLKPSNILVSEGRVKVIDFGVAKATQGSADTLFTRQAQVVGTPAYMSPEQSRSAGLDIDTRTDVYALGVVLYELLTGVLPIDSKRLSESSLAEMQRILLQEEPPPPSVRLTRLSAASPGSTESVERSMRLRGDLDWVVMKAIRKDRNERYASVTALAEDLRRFLSGEPVSAVPPTLGYRAGKFVRRHRGAVAAVAIVTLTLIAATAVSVSEAVKANRAQHQSVVTVADMYARSGLAAATDGDPARAALWFANAAIIARDDPDRREANRVRAASWGREIHSPVRALRTGFPYGGQMLWNASGNAMILPDEEDRRALVWDLEADRVWTPGFPQPLQRAAWHPSGSRIAACFGSHVAVMEFPSGKVLARRECGPIRSLAFTADGGALAIGSADPELWHWETGAARRLPPNVQLPHRIQFSPDGRWLLVRWSGMAGVCSLDQPGVFVFAPLAVKEPSTADFVGAGQEFFIAAREGGFEVRSAAKGEVIDRSEPGHQDSRPVAAASPDGRFIVAGNAPAFDRTTHRTLDFPRHKNVIGCLAFSPDGAWLASGGYDDVLKLWALPSGQLVEQLGHHQSAVLRVAFSPDGTLLASCEDGLIRVWRLATPPLIRGIPTGTSSLARLSRDGRQLVASGLTHQGGNLTRTWLADVATGKPLGPELDPGGVIMDAALSPDGSWLATATSTTPDRQRADLVKLPGSGNLQFWDPITGRRLGNSIALPAEPRGLAIHPTGKWVGVVCNSGYGVEVTVATRESAVLFHDGRNHHAGATLMNGRCAYSPDGRVFASWGLLEYIHLWDRGNVRELVEPYRFDSSCFDVDFSGDVISTVWVSRTNRIEFRDLRTGSEVRPYMPQSGWPFLGRFSPDGRLFLTASRDRVGRVWDWRKGALLCPVLPHEDEVMAGCFIPGKSWVATGGHDGWIKLWDSRTGMLMAPPTHRNGLVLDLQATPDGGTLLACGHLGGEIELLDLHGMLPEPRLDLEDARLLAEIEAAAQVHSGGDLVPLGTEEWFERWQAFRGRHPGHPGHRLTLDPQAEQAWQGQQIRALESANPGAAGWHRARLTRQ